MWMDAEPAGLHRAARLGRIEGVLQSRVVRRLDLELVVLDSPDALEQSPRGWAGGALAVFVVDTAVAGTHEEAGLREPGDRATEVRAVHRENQKPNRR